MRPPLALELAMRSWENWQKLWGWEASSLGSLVCSACLSEEGNISCPLLFKFVLLWIWTWGTPWLVIFSFPGITIAFRFVLFCVLRSWLGFPPVVHELHCGQCPTECCQCSWKLAKSFLWLSLGVVLRLERVSSFAPSLSMLLGSMVKS